MSAPRPERLERLDAGDDVALDAFYDCWAAGGREGLAGWASVRPRNLVAADLRAVGGRDAQTGFLLRAPDSGEVLAVGLAALPRFADVGTAELMPVVAPAHRRRGHGATMLRHLEAFALDAGRRVATSESEWPHDLGPDGAGWPGAEFARHHGYALALGDVQRAVDLPLDADLLDRLAVEAEAHHAEYVVRAFTGPVPADLEWGWCELDALLRTEAPTGDKVVEVRTPDLAALARDDARNAATGRTRVAAVAVTHDGAAAAYTEVVVMAAEPHRAFQRGTLVRPGHRGHRLGLAVKVAMHRLLQRDWPEVRTLVTFNAEVNAPMITVNSLLGYRPMARMGEFQKHLG